jgi:hypothetical protein
LTPRRALVALVIVSAAARAEAQSSGVRDAANEWLSRILLSATPPTYDRTNGLSLGVAPDFSPTTNLTLIPRLTYRSQLGRYDPTLVATLSLGDSLTVRGFVGRDTYTNDAWIWSDMVNSIETLALGHDSRNYVRAKRAELSLANVWATKTSSFAPHIGIRLERAESARPDSAATGGPWSVRGRYDPDDMLRPNVRVTAPDHASIVGGLRWDAAVEDVTARVEAAAEAASAFRQLTFDGQVAFPTFGVQRYRVELHAVVSGGATPTQRWVFLGGPGTIRGLELLEQGGDQLLYVDNRYDIPLSTLVLGRIGSPTLTLREVLGSAGLGSLPSLEQRAGARIKLAFVYAEGLIDPTRHRMHFGVGLSAAR